jgi:antitoxin VapB
MKLAKLFQNGQSQAVRLPKEFRFEGSEVFIKRLSNSIVLIPAKNSWQPLLDSLSMFTDDFMTKRNQPIQQQKRGKLFD